MIANILKLLFQNIWYKLGALVIAIVCWAIVQGDEVVEYNRRIKVVLSVAEGYAIKDGPVRYLQATLRVPKILTGDFINRPIEARASIPAGQVGAIDIPFEKEFIQNWDHRIKINVKESFISVFVDEEISREIPVREVLAGTPAPGFFVERISLKPDKIMVKGIKSDVLVTEAILTEPIDISKITASKTYSVQVETKPFIPSAFSKTQIEVTVHLGDAPVNKKFTAIPIETVGTTNQVILKPQFISIYIQGSSGALEFVKNTDFRAFVELTNLQPGRYDRTVQVKIPTDTVLIETFPEKVRVDVLPQ
jgi:hypothetical protein